MASHHHNQNPPFFVDALICDEEDHYWDDADTSNDTDTTSTCSMKYRGEIKIPEPFRHESFYVLSDDDEELSSLLSKEQSIDFEKNPYPCSAEDRFEAVEWLLRVIGYYSFSALTAVLAVNYLDRWFLCCFQPQRDKPWMTQLATVACLSLAAKVEETRVPLLLDLQVEGCKFVFESKTIQRMELLVLSTLEWKMNPVTPLSFLDYIARRLALNGEFLKRCHFLILSVIPDCRFISYLPSALATATMLCILSSLEPCSSVQYQDQLMGLLGINKDSVEGCCGLIQEVATSAEFHSSIRKRKFGYLPNSPRGFFDVTSFGSYNSNDLWALASVPSSPETVQENQAFGFINE